MAIKEVNSWLNGSRNYNHGVSLYCKLGTNQVFKDQFQRSQNSYTERKLVELLEALNLADAPSDRLPEKPVRKPQDLSLKAFEPKQEHTFAKVDLTHAPAALVKMDNRRKALFQQASTHWEMVRNGDFETKPDRFEALQLIHSNFYGKRGIQAIWKRIDHWAKYGRFIPFSDDTEKEPLDIRQVERQMLNARSDVSRYKNNPDKKHLYDKHLQKLHELEQYILDYDEAK